VNDELDCVCRGDADLKQAAIDSSADEHAEIVEIEHSDWVAVGVKNVIVCDPVFACALQDNGIHEHQLTLIKFPLALSVDVFLSPRPLSGGRSGSSLSAGSMFYGRSVSMIYYAARVSPEDHAAIVSSNDPDMIYELAQTGIGLGKMWSAAGFVITNGDTGASEPLWTGVPVGVDFGFGPAALASPEDVARVAATLEHLSEDELVSRFDPAALDAEMIYPDVWSREPAEHLAAEVTEAAMRLIELYQTAAANGDAVLALML